MFVHCILTGIFPKAVIGALTFQTHSNLAYSRLYLKTKQLPLSSALEKTSDFGSMTVNCNRMNLIKDPFTVRSAIRQTFYGAISVCPAL